MTELGSSTKADAGTEGGQWVVTRVGAAGYRADVSARSHAFVVDEPVALRGTDAGATPYEHLLAALGGCTAITLRMYADRKGWPLDGIEVRLRSARSHAVDCADCDVRDADVGRIERRILLHGALDDEQRRRLLAIADRCPLKQSLARGLVVVDAADPSSSPAVSPGHDA